MRPTRSRGCPGPPARGASHDTSAAARESENAHSPIGPYRPAADGAHHPNTVTPPIDPLTGLMTLPAWEEALEREHLRRSRYRRPVALMSVRVDALAAAEDRYGRAAADELLLATTQILRGTLRATDVVSRINETDFAVLLPETAAETMPLVADRIRDSARRWEGVPAELRLSLRVGWAVPDAFGDLRETLRDAERQQQPSEVLR